METYSLILIAFILLVVIPGLLKRRRIAAIRHIMNKKKNNGENNFMKELAQKFIGKDCMVYTVASDTSSVKGVIKEISDNALLIDCDGNLQAINLDYVTRIREWPKNKNGKKKEIIFD